MGGRRPDVRLTEGTAASGKRNDAIRVTGPLPQDVDSAPRRGLREWLVEPETTAEALFGGKAVSMMSPQQTWEVLDHGVDEAGDCSYNLALRTTVDLPGTTPRRLICHKSIKIPIDSARVCFEYTWELQGGSPVLWALELPVRQGVQESRLFVEGKQVIPPQAASQGRAAYVEGADGSILLLEFSRPTPLWWHPVRTIKKDVQGFSTIQQGLLLAPVVRIDGHAGLKIALDMHRRAK